MTPELKPCPFCGSRAELNSSPRRDIPDSLVWCPSCTNEDKCWAASGQTWYAHKEDAIRDWNRRTPDLTEALARLKALEGEMKSPVFVGVPSVEVFGVRTVVMPHLKKWADEIAAIRKTMGARE